jgi:hypothetical protein
MRTLCHDRANYELYCAMEKAGEAFQEELTITYGEKAVDRRYFPQPLEPVNVYRAREAFRAAAEAFWNDRR